ncbi:MAG: class I SAM-dependent methyltransferase [Salinivenus sp.]
MDSTTPDHPGRGGDDRVERTIRWYDQHAEEYAEWTRGIDLSGLRARFLEHVPEGGHVLDIGCGAGRDAKAFLEQGYDVTALDASKEMARLASEYTQQEVLHRRMEEFEPETYFDGVWACASLLHVPKEKLPAAFDRLAGGLRPGGALYASFWAGERRGTERFFNEVSREEVASLIEETDGLGAEEIWRSGDAEGREGVQWINALSRRRDPEREGNLRGD